MGTLQSWRKAYGALKDTTKVGLVRVNSDYASKRKTREPKDETVTLGPAVHEGEQVFGVVHVFASFNDTFIELGITAIHVKLRATGGNKTKTSGTGAQSALRALARSGMKIGRIGTSSATKKPYSRSIVGAVRDAAREAALRLVLQILKLINVWKTTVGAGKTNLQT